MASKMTIVHEIVYKVHVFIQCYDGHEMCKIV